ncbi:toxin co-regulated pilus biosynthesis Q family protein, partial [Clostridioides difficile]|nr:toxin co-regulated pilus biosynthesis Q family protein [Clostridioides difficile]
EQATPAAEVWTIREGFPISEELKSWGSRANWSVVWQMPRDVIAAATTPFSGDFPPALTDVVKTLAANGALIRARIFDGNRTVVVQGPGVPA